MTLESLHSLLSGRSMRVHVDVDIAEVAGSFKEEALLFDSLQGEESLSGLPEYSVRLLHRCDRLDLGGLLGRELKVEIRTAAAPRYVGGLITTAQLLGPSDHNDRYFSYACQVSPWFWLATLKKEFRIYQHLTVPQIVVQVLEPYGSDFTLRLLDKYSPRTYCVQYGETDFDFVSRLLEDEGIHYYFQYEAGKHTLIMSDDLMNHAKVKGYEEVPYYEHDKLAHAHTEYLSAYQPVERVCVNKYSAKDYNFLGPYAPLAERAHWPVSQAHHPEGEVYEWPGGYKEYEVGERYVRKRVEELRHQREYQQFSGTVRGLVTGAVFRLRHDPRSSHSSYYPPNKRPNSYIVLATHYDLKESPYQSIARTTPPAAQTPETPQTMLPGESTLAEEQPRCVMRLTVQDQQQPFRPLRHTPKPRTLGPQTAVVVGPQGQEIWTNAHGQVKVHFQWDRYDQRDENSSCWIRVSSAWASNNFGAIQIPRIGDEVIVDFLNGDPDHPIITGRVYNASKMPPWELPQNATQMVILARLMDSLFL